MNTPRFEFETHCPDGQECGCSATTGCIKGKCQRKGSITCKHWLNLQAGESHTLTIAGDWGCPVCRSERLETELSACQAKLRQYDLLISRLTSSVENWKERAEAAEARAERLEKALRKLVADPACYSDHMIEARAALK
jgi:hypothetical protein